MDEILKLVEPLFASYGGDFGIVVQVMSILGSIRAVNKPLFSTLNALVNATYWTDDDNQLLARLENNKIYKGLIYVLDWVVSVKVGRK